MTSRVWSRPACPVCHKSPKAGQTSAIKSQRLASSGLPYQTQQARAFPGLPHGVSRQMACHTDPGAPPNHRECFVSCRDVAWIQLGSKGPSEAVSVEMRKKAYSLCPQLSTLCPVRFGEDSLGSETPAQSPSTAHGQSHLIFLSAAAAPPLRSLSTEPWD